MKLNTVVSVISLLMLSACAAPKPIIVSSPEIPENSFKGIVARSTPEPGLFMREVRLQTQPQGEPAQLQAINLNYVWFYQQRQTLGQHLSAWAHRFAYRFESSLPPGADPVVKSDGSYVGNLYAAIEDLSFFADQGRSNFMQVDNVKKLSTHGLLITISETQRYMRIEPGVTLSDQAQISGEATRSAPGNNYARGQ